MSGVGGFLGAAYHGLGAGVTREGRALARRNPAAFLAVFVWPVAFGALLVAYGATSPTGGMFGLGAHLAGLKAPPAITFITAGLMSITAGLTPNRWVRALALGAITFALLGRVATLLLSGSQDLTRLREVGAAAVLLASWAGATLVHFLATPDAGIVAAASTGVPKHVVDSDG